MGLEFELKYAANPGVQEKIREKLGNFREFSMETTYFDTPAGALSRRRITLRSRIENGLCVCTLKTPAAGHGRGEWDAVAPWSAETVELLWQKSGELAVPFGELTPVCGAKFVRHAFPVELEDCVLEVALDLGLLLGGGRKIPLCEVEVELKSGSEEAATQWAEALAAEFGLHPEPRSKFSRASALAKGV